MIAVLRMIKDFFLSTVTLGGVELPFNYAELLFEIILPIAIYVILFRLIVAGMRKILGRTKIKEEVRKKTVLWIRRVLIILFCIFILLLFGRLFGAEMFSYIKLFYQFLSRPFFESGSTKISFITIILAIPIIYLSSWAAKMIRTFFDKSVLVHLSLDEAKKFSLSNLIRYGSLVILLMIGLSIIGLDVSSLAVIFGALGIGLGFGLQNVVSNFFSGIVIIFARPIKEGDRINVHGSEGTVVQIRLISTVINTLTNESIIVPNSQIVNEKVYNFSYDDRRIIIVNTVQVSYGTDLDAALSVLDGIGRRNPYAIPGEEPIVRVESFDDSGITLSLRTWVDNVDDKYEGLSWANLEIWREFKLGGIVIPFPQMDIHVKEK